MAVVKLKEVSIIGKLADIDDVATVCGKTNAFHADNALNWYADAPDVTSYSEENPYSEPLQQLTDAIGKAGKTLTLLSEKESKSLSMNKDELISYAKDIANKITELDHNKLVAQDQLQKYTEAMKDMEHFVGLNLNLDDINACQYVNVRFGCLPKENYEKLGAYHDNPNVVFTPCAADQEKQWGLYMAPIDGTSEADRIFTGLKFHRVTLDHMSGTPEQTVQELRKLCDEQNSIIKSAEADISAIWSREQAQIQKVYTLLTEKNVYFSAICRNAARYDDNFVITGWIPKEYESQLKSALAPFDLMELSFKMGDEVQKHNPPTAIKNRGPFKFFEFFVDLYGMPSYGEFDPTKFVAVTYTLLFGIMFGDLGQGLCIAAIGAFMGYKLKMAIGKVLIPCGISSAIFGFFFGSVFGYEDWLNPVHTAMGIDTPAGVSHTGGPSKLIETMAGSVSSWVVYATIGLGVILIVIAMGIGVVSNLKRKNIEAALFGPSGIAGMVLFVGVAGVLATILLGESMPFQLLNLGWLLGMILAPTLVIFFKDLLGAAIEGHKLNVGVGDFIMQNFFELLEVFIGYMSNAMSFLRVGAFVLVHAGMMMVVFTLANMAAGIFPVYLIIVIIGNAVISGLECLLVCIQVLRLQFYELFSRYYDGGGRKYEPVLAHAEQAA